MRKFLIPLLLASALAPATAYAKDGPVFTRGQHSQSDRGNRDSSSESHSSDSKPQRVERSERADRPVRVERSERADRPARIERVERPDRPVRIERAENSGGEQRMERRIRRGDRPVIQGDTVQEVRAIEPAQTQPVRRVVRGGLLSGAVTARRDGDGNPDRTRDRDRDGENDRWRDRDGDNNRWRDRNGNWRRWTGDWRRDNRYDWHNYRSRYGSLFRLGRYYDPYGYNYRRFSIGFNLWPSYYGSSFWLDDPWQYRLPPAYGPYRWIRYYDDALLVNIYTGQVVDVIHNVFW